MVLMYFPSIYRYYMVIITYQEDNTIYIENDIDGDITNGDTVT